MNAIEIDRSWHLSAEGWLGGWWGTLLGILLCGFAIYQLRSELGRGRSGDTVRRVLPWIRVSVVALFVWLLCQPVFRTVERTRDAPTWVVLVDEGGSMQVHETFGGVSRTLDVLGALNDTPIPKRDTYASQLARAADEYGKALDAPRRRLALLHAEVKTGLPPGDEARRLIEHIGAALPGLADRMTAPEPETYEDESLIERLEHVRAVQQTLGALAYAVSEECELVAREASNQPALLGSFLGRLNASAERATALGKEASSLQVALDEDRLGDSVLADHRRRRITRQNFGEMAAGQLARRLGTDARLKTVSVKGISAALVEADRRSRDSALTGVVYVGDGSADPSADDAARMQHLSAAGVVVHTVLAGPDGVTPPDVGVIAAELPRVLVRDERVVANIGVKQRLPDGATARLEVRFDDTVIASVDVDPALNGRGVLQLPLKPPKLGRHQITFTIHADADRYPGNETFVCTVDVLAKPATVLLVSDRVSSEFAAYRELLRAMPSVLLQELVGAPELSKLKVSREAGSFPSDADAWSDIDLAVLVGGIPSELAADEAAGAWSPPVEGLRGAVERGLHVLVNELPDLDERSSWTRALGLDSQEPSEAHPLELDVNLWPDLYQLDLDDATSRSVWAMFPAVNAHTLIDDTCMPLLRAGGGPVLALVPRGEGMIVFNGMPPLCSLRDVVEARFVNRLTSEIVTHALRPLEEEIGGGMTMALFPPQPVLGHDVLARSAHGHVGLRMGEGGDVRASSGPAPSGWDRFALTHEDARDSIVAIVGASELRRAPRSRLADSEFTLTPRSAPLERIAKTTGGIHVDIESIEDLVALMRDAKGATIIEADAYRLWRGWWVLFVLLALVTAEYLLRRRAGRVM